MSKYYFAVTTLKKYRINNDERPILILSIKIFKKSQMIKKKSTLSKTIHSRR